MCYLGSMYYVFKRVSARIFRIEGMAHPRKGQQDRTRLYSSLRLGVKTLEYSLDARKVYSWDPDENRIQKNSKTAHKSILIHIEKKLSVESNISGLARQLTL